MSTVLVGYSSLEHLEAAIRAAARGALPAAAMRRLEQAWAAFPAPSVIAPGMHEVYDRRYPDAGSRRV